MFCKLYFSQISAYSVFETQTSNPEIQESKKITVKLLTQKTFAWILDQKEEPEHLRPRYTSVPPPGVFTPVWTKLHRSKYFSRMTKKFSRLLRYHGSKWNCKVHTYRKSSIIRIFLPRTKNLSQNWKLLSDFKYSERFLGVA